MSFCPRSSAAHTQVQIGDACLIPLRCHCNALQAWKESSDGCKKYSLLFTVFLAVWFGNFRADWGGDFQAEGWAGSDTWRLLRMQESHVCESPQRRAQAETNTSYCSCAPQFAMCSVPYILLLTESDIRMMEGLGFLRSHVLCWIIMPGKGELNTVFDQTYMDVCFRADHHHHLAVHTGRHCRGERGPALPSEPWPVSGAQVHLVLQWAAHPLREPRWIFWESGRRKSIIPRCFSKSVRLSGLWFLNRLSCCGSCKDGFPIYKQLRIHMQQGIRNQAGTMSG